MYLPRRSDALKRAPRAERLGSDPFRKDLKLSSAMESNLSCIPRTGEVPPARSEAGGVPLAALFKRQRRRLRLRIRVEGHHVLLDVERWQGIYVVRLELVEPCRVDADVL